jgi:murein DD-endopeptidase MepM/ murein hydrolase activator NlpD
MLGVLGTVAEKPSAYFSLPTPVSGKVDHRFDFLPAWQAVAIPKALRFDSPMGTEHAGLVYNAQPFWDMNESRGGHHTGDDLNGIGGMNSDLGDPVFCVADGLVLFASDLGGGWGQVVIVGHRLPAGEILHSMYAHLSRTDAKLGTLISRGEKIGQVGTAGGLYLAHLHFEIRASDHLDIGPGYAAAPLNHLAPSPTIESLRNARPYELSPSPLRFISEKPGK